MRWRVARHFAVSSGVLAVFGCGDDWAVQTIIRGRPFRAEAAQSVRRDDSVSQAQPTWAVDPKPIFEIGGSAGAEESLLTGIVGLAVFEGGPLVVANRGFQIPASPTGVSTSGSRRGDNTLRYFDLGGKFLGKAGGVGSGPHEFGRLGGLHRVGTEVWATESWGRPIKVFDKTGRFVRSVRTNPGSGLITQVVGVLASGTIIAFGVVGGVPAPGKLQVDSIRIFRIPPSGSSTTLMTIPLATRIGQRGLPAVQAYGSGGIVKTGRNALYVAWTGDPQVRVFDESGTQIRVLRWDAERIRVTDADKAAYRDRLRTFDSTTPPVRGQPKFADVAATMVFPAYHRVINAMEIDDEDNVWLQLPQGRPGSERTDVPSTWSVFDTAGTLVGKVSLPAGFWPRAIGRDHVTGVWRDEDDVEHVRMYRLHRGRD